MKKLTLAAALLGATYFANAQVGIGTPNPADASQLEIFVQNKDKGILIPRVELRNTAEFSPITGTEVESLLVYNTATAGDVTPGFYYWFNNNWERIVNQTQLDEAITNITDLQDDVDKILTLLKVAFPSNNLVDPSVVGDTHGGGMVFIPGDGTTEPKIEYVYFDGTNYITKDITADIISIIQGAESKTFFRKIVDATTGNAQYIYFSEDAIQAWLVADSANTIANIPDDAPGAFLITATLDVVNNFENILNQTTEYKGNTVTIEKIIQEIAGTVEGNVIYKNIGDATNPEWVFQYFDGTTYQTINLGDIVKANESVTHIDKNENGTVADGDVEITYDYFNEVDTTTTPQATIDVNADLKKLIEGNTVIQNAITKILNDGGNVYFGDHDDDATTEDVLYTIIDGDKTPIDITGTILTIIEDNSQEIKNILGDNFSDNTVVNTGDTWIDGNNIYRGVFNATIVAKTANILAPVTLTGTTIGNVIDIKILNAATNQLINTTTTNVAVNGNDLDFKIGSGNMYVVLAEAATADFNIKVIVEYSAEE